jgi:hypothetical protein
MSRKLRREIRERGPIILMLAQEVDAQRASYAARSASMNTRLSVLVAAASLATGLQVDLQTPHFWYLLGSCLAAGAAIAGVVALWPRYGGENGVEELQRELWNYPPDMARYVLLHRQLDVLKEDEGRLSVRAWCARIGYSLLALSIVAVALQLTMPLPFPLPFSTSVPTPSPTP